MRGAESDISSDGKRFLVMKDVATRLTKSQDHRHRPELVRGVARAARSAASSELLEIGTPCLGLGQRAELLSLKDVVSATTDMPAAFAASTPIGASSKTRQSAAAMPDGAPLR